MMRVFRQKTRLELSTAAFEIRYSADVTEAEDADKEQRRAGLCVDCLHAQRIQSARGSTFYRCKLSDTDPSFPKYPRLPVLHCPGYIRKA
jgi:hypothetical protein